MKYEISVASKTFLLGEYAVLKSKPAIILTTEPRFKLIITENKSNHQQTNSPFHPDSPVGKYFKKHFSFFRHYTYEFIDPYHGVGGFGASSAQLIMLVSFKHFIEKEIINEFKLLSEYKKLSRYGEGHIPSGVDLIAQLHGGICYIDKKARKIQQFSWLFDDLSFGLIATGKKILTHEHLKTLITFDEEPLTKIIKKGLLSLKQANSEEFISAINLYQSTLTKMNLVASHAQEIINKIKLQSFILASKGCGALGSDVILIIFKRKNTHDVLSWLRAQKLQLLNEGHEIAQGLEIKIL